MSSRFRSSLLCEAAKERHPSVDREREEVGMGSVIGDLLPLAVGVAVSPIPIIAAILMSLSKRAGSTSVGFALAGYSESLSPL